ncbi:MAG TPA: methyl-accepting chemotaxis protein [Ignavibacteriaceae bacterium]|nr:methyl-accepting chemotaxis protein [Ignavibacteriaceae bacterium]
MEWFNNLKIGTKLYLSFISFSFISAFLSFFIFPNSGITELFFLFIPEVLLSIILGAFISKKINKTIKDLTCMLHELSKGHICERSKITSKDELGAFSAEMNQFTDYLQNSVLSNINKISEGNFTFDYSFSDEKDLFSKALTKLAKVSSNLKNETVKMAEAYDNGNTDYRVNESLFPGDYKKIIENINKTLNQIVMVVRKGYVAMQSFSEGDLTARMDGDYKGAFNRYKTNINNLGGSLEKMIFEVSKIIESTAVSTNEISSRIEEISTGTTEQSQQASEVASAVEEMTKTILETSKNADSASEASKRYGDIAKEGGQVVNQTVEGMSRIASVVKKSAVTVHALGKSSVQINEIIGVIDDIADQTNLLALNAAIEAARAGEQGRGFAVVADEVKKLAERTTKATKEIGSMIKQIQSDTKEAVSSMELGTAEVEKGIELADHAGNSLKQIIDGADNVVDLIAQVAAASEEQSSASEQISKSIESINNVTQESSVNLQQISKSANDLTELTGKLEKLISNFKINIKININENVSKISINKRAKLIEIN